MKKRLLIAALCGVLMALPISPEAHAQGVNLTGTWQVKSDKVPGVTILKLIQSGDSVSGTWQPAQGNPSHSHSNSFELGFEYLRCKLHEAIEAALNGFNERRIPACRLRNRTKANHWS